MIPLILYALLALGVSFLCSLLEAALLSVPRSYVALLVEGGSSVGKRLQHMKANIDKPLSAILTLNTIAHTIGAAGVGAESAAIFGSNAVGWASAIMTLLILVLSEIIPKTLGAVHAKRLAGFTAVATKIMMWITAPIVVALEWANRLIGFKRHDAPVSRAELLATLRLGREAGTLDSREYQIVSNLMALGKVSVRDIATPRSVIFALSADKTVDEAFEESGVFQFARIPIYEGSIDHPIGYATRHDIYRAQQSGKSQSRLSEFIKPIYRVSADASVSACLENMLTARDHIAIVQDDAGATVGLLSLEDAIETLLGVEIVDETDPVVDLQALALRLEQGMLARREAR